MIRVVIVDDDALVRTGIRLILGGESDIEIVGEAADGVEAEVLIREARPDVALVDIRMPVQDGLTTIDHLMQWPEHPHVIVLTTFDADESVVRALGAGAAGFLLKDTAPARLINAVRSIALGDAILSPGITRQLVAAAAEAGVPVPDAAIESLTPREREIAIAVARGQSNAEIAQQLFISVATVKAGVTQIFLKLDADNRVHAAMRMRDAGLL